MNIIERGIIALCDFTKDSDFQNFWKNVASLWIYQQAEKNFSFDGSIL